MKSRTGETYKRVNRLFADRILEEVNDQPAIVFIQEYHFALLPSYLKERNPSIVVAQFWHIPWPDPEVFGLCPWQEEIIDGLLGNDLIGFHTTYYGTNFINAVERVVESRIDLDYRHVFRRGHRTSIRAFPIGVDFEAINAEAQSDEVNQEIDRPQA